MLNLFYSYSFEVDSAYIITIKGNKNSEELSSRCQSTCNNVGMPYTVWDAYDGLGSHIIEPDHSKNNTIMGQLKITDHYMTKGEVACALSHISLWSHCATIDKPIVILEHDAVMIKKYENHTAYNSIVYLGGNEWAKKNWPMLYVPPHATEGPNYHFICRAHAYSIDPAMAKNLLSHVLKFGIIAPLDIMMRTDIFNVSHNGLYAYDENDDPRQTTTIKARPVAGRTTARNDRLEY